MVSNRSLLGCVFLIIPLITTASSSVASLGRATQETHNGEGIVEAYMMARDTVQDLIDQGRSPDPNGDEMELLSYWRDQLNKSSQISAQNLRTILEGDPGVGNTDPETRRSVAKRTIERNLSKRWTGGIVPFIYTSDTNAEHQREIKRAMEHYQRFSCIRFVPWENTTGTTTNQKLGLDHPGYLKFVVRNGCWSHQGNFRWSDGQELSCCSGGSCVHELGHALGVLHEQQSPNPDRNRFIRINPQYITDNEYQWYEQKLPGNFISYGYDISSPMHYSTTFYRKGPGKTFTHLFPELKEGGNFYYHVREVSIEHKCQDQCKGFPVTCENDGYLTKVDGNCRCRCIPGLDPDTGCKTIYKHDFSGLKFPGGQYALPAHTDGCPNGSFKLGSRKHFNNGGNDRSAKFAVKTDVTANMVEESFCVSNTSNNRITWPEGNYCIYRVGGACPEGFFSEGSVKYDDQPTGSNRNSHTGELPDGIYGEDTKYQYCCKNTGFNDDILFFPSRKPFVLIKRRDERCQNVQGMHLEVNTLTVGNLVNKNNSETDAAIEGDHPIDKIIGTSEAYSMKYCVYKPAMMNCGDVFELDSSKKEVTFSSPDDVELECFWLVKAPKGQRVALDFTEFDISGFPGMCKDDLIVHYSRPGQLGKRYCGRIFDKTIVSIYNTILIRLSTYSGYRSRFSARVRLIQDEDLCYKRADRGHLTKPMLSNPGATRKRSSVKETTVTCVL
ncbi:metalloendopeptidase [Elysia marginata]|uniref:Metalloendopeptidase n=1 Tax=Elysia marginata TaxID=1093978 RepID=A0AAV4JCQ8_9GAST|nr:metalloendopeptidase [Elysia marginata]